MSDDMDRPFVWICSDCGEKYEETDLSQLEAKIMTHKCKILMRQETTKEAKRG